MRRAGISGVRAKKRGRTTIRVPGVRVCEDLVDRAFLASAPDRLWVADILRTWEGWPYLVAVHDVFSRRIVGWSMAEPPAHRAGERRLAVRLMGIDGRADADTEAAVLDALGADDDVCARDIDVETGVTNEIEVGRAQRTRDRLTEMMIPAHSTRRSRR